jgi:cystathionine gamma-synthase
MARTVKAPLGLATRAIHGAGRKTKAHHAVSTPIVHTSNFSFDSTTEVFEYMQAKADGRHIREAEYGRYGNPTQQEAERKLAAIEGAQRAILFSTGMSAVISSILALIDKGQHIVFTSDCYRQTRDFALNFLPKFGIETTVAEPDLIALQKAIRPNTKILFTESPTNPYLRVLDLEAIVALPKRHRLLTLIDATLATPYNLRPIEAGVDLVLHSATKYLGGHNDLLAGAALGSDDLVEQIYKFQRMLGAVPGGLTCFLLERGLKTFALRMEHHNRSGLAVARALEAHPSIQKVWYPGLESHPDHALATRTMRGFGSVITFMVRGGDAETRKFIDQLKLFVITPSLGGSESLVTQMAMMSFFDYSKEYRESIGMVDNLVRIALGLEDTDDLIADLNHALGSI